MNETRVFAFAKAFFYAYCKQRDGGDVKKLCSGIMRQKLGRTSTSNSIYDKRMANHWDWGCIGIAAQSRSDIKYRIHLAPSYMMPY
jgi:hypothetical protein